MYRFARRYEPRESLTPEQEELQTITKIKYIGKEQPWKNCPVCDSEPADHEVMNHSLTCGDGDVYCTRCGAYVRMWDSG